jgi:hypothetical protein
VCVDFIIDDAADTATWILRLDMPAHELPAFTAGVLAGQGRRWSG